MPDEVVIRVEGLGKKFCRSLKRAMFYTGVDLARSLCGKPVGGGSLRRDEFWALQDIAFEVRKGECLGLIGPNGSGKSTLLKIMNGIILPDTGRVSVRGRVGALIQVGTGFHPRLTGRENIYITAAMHGLSRAETDRRFESIVEFAGLREFLDMPVHHYSSGMVVRLGYSVMAHVNPDILLIDEVLAVGDIGFRYKCLRRLEEQIAGGCTPILVTHSMEALLRVCTRVVVLSRGRKVYDGDLEGGVATYQKELWNTRTGAESAVQVLDPAVSLREASARSGTGTGRARTGQDVELSLVLDVRQPVDPLRVEIGLESLVYGAIASTDSVRAGVTIPGHTGVREISVTLPHLPLLPGHFMMRVNVSERRTGRLFFRQFGAAQLRVEGAEGEGFEGRFLVALNETWRVR